MKGRILKVKTGYNPNSSSVGSAIPAYIIATVAVGAVSVLIANLLTTAGKNIKKNIKQKEQDELQENGKNGKEAE